MSYVRHAYARSQVEVCLCYFKRFKNKFNGAICALHVSQSFVKKRKMNEQQQKTK